MFFCIRKNILGGVYPYDQLAGVGGQVKKDAKKQEAPTRFALVEVEVIHMETGEKMCVLGKIHQNILRFAEKQFGPDLQPLFNIFENAWAL